METMETQAAPAPASHPLPDGKTLALKTLETAAGYIGENRGNARGQITKFLEVEGLGFADEHGKPYPYCAAGVSYAALKALCLLSGRQFTPENSVEVFRAAKPVLAAHFFKPSAGVMEIVEDARARGSWVADSAEARKRVLPGWLVAYHFPTGHHIEIVRAAHVSALDTVGFNTSDADSRDGGAIADKTRGYGSVMGYVALYH